MANGTVVNPTGDKIYDNDGGDGFKYPASHILTGASGAPGAHVTVTNPFPVRYCDASGFVLPLVAGQLPASLVGGRVDTNNGAWLGSTAPTVGSKTSANSLPVVIASDQGNVPVALQAGVTRYYPSATPGQTASLNLNAGAVLRVGPMSEVDVGAVTGAPWLLAPEVSEDFRQRVEIDNFLDEEVFCYSAQNTGKHTVDTTTMTLTYSGAAMNTNGGSITTINTGVAFSTRRSFPISTAASTAAYMKVVFQAAVPTNTTIDFGFFQRPTATPYAPTDGVYFRATSAGVFGVMNSGGTETVTSAFVVAFGGATFVPTVGTEYDCIVTSQPNISVFWIDLRDGNGYIRMATLSSNSTTKPRPIQSGSAPFSVRHAIGGTAASAGMSFKVVSYGVYLGGQALNVPWSEMQNTAGHSGAQGQSGQTQGSTASYANSTAPTAAVMTNTTAALGTGLGGQFACTPTLAVNTDGIVCSFQNPAGTATLTGRPLIIDSIKIDAVVVVALNASPPVYVYSAAWGNTSVSLATAESANTKAPRRKTLGLHAISSVAIGASGAPIGQIKTTDIAVQPGEFFAITAKNVAAAAPASGTILFIVTICSHWAN